jgi:stage II sporulation protein D
VGSDRIDVEALDGESIEVRQVEFGVGYDFHGFEDRRYRGAIRFAIDRRGMLAVVNLVPLEALLQGLVPSEIFARAHAEALKAQAVTARGEVLAKVGTRHLGDPYLLCAEQHCAVYRGLSGEAASTNAAVEATRGEALFSRDGRLVDSVYSALCGGHTEDNQNVWGGIPNPHLRGRPDLLRPSGRVPTPKDLPRYLDADLPVACRLSTLAAPGKYRWERRFTSADVDALLADLGVGAVRALSVIERGVSGRATALLVSGERAAVELRGELVIRRRFRMLNSSMFEIAAEPDEHGHVQGWKFHGGGWGHGVGLCQTGAIGRAEAGQSYREILRHYFSGARVTRIY